jgi:hypothetical protein
VFNAAPTKNHPNGCKSSIGHYLFRHFARKDGGILTKKAAKSIGGVKGDVIE